MNQHGSPTTTPSSPPKPRRSITPDLLDLITDLSRQTGVCWAGDVSLACMLARRLGRPKPYTDRRIRQAIQELAAAGVLVIERGQRGRQLRPAQPVIDPLPQPWTAADFRPRLPHNPEQKEEKENNNKPDVVDVGKVLEILEESDIDDDAWIEITSRLPGYVVPEARGLVLPDRLFALNTGPVQDLKPESRVEVPAPEPQPDAPLVAKLVEHGVTLKTARGLVQDHAAEAIERQVAALPHRTVKEPTGALIASIRDGWPMPEGIRRQEQTREREKMGIKSQADGAVLMVRSHLAGLPDWLMEMYEVAARKKGCTIEDHARGVLGLADEPPSSPHHPQ